MTRIATFKKKLYAICEINTEDKTKNKYTCTQMHAYRYKYTQMHACRYKYTQMHAPTTSTYRQACSQES